jgi:thioredoxin 1
MSKNNIFVMSIIALVIVVGGFLFLGSSDSGDDSAMVANNTVQSGSAGQKSDSQTATTSDTWFTPFSSQALAAAQESGQKPVIFFSASWCSSCQAAARDFSANSDKIPSDVTILKANYDTDIELKKKYRVVVQDTFVQVDADGNEVTKWNSGGRGVASLLRYLK